MVGAARGGGIPVDDPRTRLLATGLGFLALRDGSHVSPYQLVRAIPTVAHVLQQIRLLELFEQPARRDEIQVGGSRGSRRGEVSAGMYRQPPIHERLTLAKIVVSRCEDGSHVELPRGRQRAPPCLLLQLLGKPSDAACGMCRQACAADAESDR